MRVVADNVITNHQHFVHNALTLLTSYSTVHVYHHAPPTHSSSATNACNAPIIAYNVQQQHHAQDVHHHIIIMKENVTLIVTQYLSNMMQEVIVVFCVQQGVILVQIMCVILVWRNILRMEHNV